MILPKFSSSSNSADRVQSLKDELLIRQLEAQKPQIEKQLAGVSQLQSMADIFNTDPSRLQDFEVQFLKDNASKAGIDISAGLQADKKGITLGKIGGLLGGVADSLLFDLIPDNAYINRHNKGWANAGKWGATIGSLALGGYGVVQAGKAAKALQAATVAAKGMKIGGEAGKAIVKELATKYSDDLVRLFGDDAAKTIGDMTLPQLQKTLSSASSSASKELKAIASKYGVKTTKSTGQSSMKFVRSSGWKATRGSVSSQAGKSRFVSNKFVTDSKVRAAINKAWERAETHSQYVTRKLSEQLDEATKKVQLYESIIKRTPARHVRKLSALQDGLNVELDKLNRIRKNLSPGSTFRRTLAKANRDQISNAIDDLSRLDEIGKIKNSSSKIRAAAQRRVAAWQKGQIPKPTPTIADKLPWYAGAPGAARSGISQLFAPATTFGGKAKNVLFALPQLGMVASPAINAGKPDTITELSSGPYGILTPIIDPNAIVRQQQYINNLPFGGMLPMMGGGQGKVDEMLNQ